jgi:hypothetical protein
MGSQNLKHLHWHTYSIIARGNTARIFRKLQDTMFANSSSIIPVRRLVPANEEGQIALCTKSYLEGLSDQEVMVGITWDSRYLDSPMNLKRLIVSTTNTVILTVHLSPDNERAVDMYLGHVWGLSLSESSNSKLITGLREASIDLSELSTDEIGRIVERLLSQTGRSTAQFIFLHSKPTSN